jgi:His/Glu/Gln/Arg/opine family amino acid ABC transporter permease subunit
MELQFEKVWPYMHYLWEGLYVTLKVTVIAFLLGLLIGIVLLLLNMTKNKLLDILVSGYVLIFRSMPVLLQLFLVYFAIPQITNNVIRFEAQTAAIIVFALNAGAFLFEVIRGGILGVDPGQREGAMALGVNSRVTMAYIIFPQALKMILPALVNEAIVVFKGSALMSQIGVMDMFLGSMTIVKSTYITFEPYILVAIIYYIIVCIMTYFAHLLERRMARSD